MADLPNPDGDPGEQRVARPRGRVYFLLACLLIPIPFLVYWLFILRPLGKLVGQ